MVARLQQTKTAPLHFREREARLRAIVEDNLLFVTRTLRKAGVPPCELDDEVQHTFIVAAKRLDDMEFGAERTFLYQVALNIAAHLRRKLARRREVMDDRVPERIEALKTPEQLTIRKEMRDLLDEVAARMGDQLYQVFKLFEFEHASLKDIATLIGVPRGTVASRLRRARAEFRKHAAALDLAWDLGSQAANSLKEPQVLSHEKVSELMDALLRVGASPGASAAVHRGALAALGLDARPRAR